MKYLKQFVQNTWSGDVTYKEAVEGFTDKQKLIMDFQLKLNKHLIAGLPEDFKPVSRGQELLQKLVNKFED